MSFGDQLARKTEALETARSSWGEFPELVSWLERTLPKYDMVGAPNHPSSPFFPPSPPLLICEADSAGPLSDGKQLAGESADTYIQRHGLLDPLVRHFFTETEEDGADDGTLSPSSEFPRFSFCFYRTISPPPPQPDYPPERPCTRVELGPTKKKGGGGRQVGVLKLYLKKRALLRHSRFK